MGNTRILRRETVASTLIVHKGRVVLVHHRKLGRWLPPGGHLESNEQPDECAVREALEETGLQVQLVQGAPGSRVRAEPGVRELVRPLVIQREIIDDEHEHVNIIFAARTAVDGLVRNDLEAADLRWMSPAEMLGAHVSMRIVDLAVRAILRVEGTRSGRSFNTATSQQELDLYGSA